MDWIVVRFGKCGKYSIHICLGAYVCPPRFPLSLDYQEMCDRLSAMSEPIDLTYMANLYMALADKTRLRLLNLMRDQEVCVGYFTDVLGDSQPKISRHLAYLRNADIVEARREGKWMHYRIKWPDDHQLSGVIDSALRSIAGQTDCLTDSQKYAQLFGNKLPKPPIPENVEIDIYANAYISEPTPIEEMSSHNELEEFLL